MQEPSWIFILFMVTMALVLVAGAFSLWRTKRAQSDEKASVPRRSS